VKAQPQCECDEKPASAPPRQPHITCQCGATFPETAMYWHHASAFHDLGPGVVRFDGGTAHVVRETWEERIWKRLAAWLS
jgi:hypothetical protein